MRGFQKSNNKESSKNEKFKVKETNLVLYKRAINLQKKGELNQAAQIYDKFIKNKYYDEKVFLNYASICQHLKNTKDAILLFRESIRIYPKNFIPFFKWVSY